MDKRDERKRRVKNYPKIFWSEQLEGWRYHQLRWKGLGQKAQELNLGHVEMEMSIVPQVLMLNIQLDI